MIYIVITLLVLNFIFDKQFYTFFKIRDKSYFVLSICFGLTLLVAFVDHRNNSYFGLGLLIIGIFIRNWGKLSLGENFKYDVRKPQQLINTGIYSIMYRIKVEEELLIKKFGKAYKNYVKQTWRLVPGLF